MKCKYYEINSTSAAKNSPNYRPVSGIVHVGPVNSIIRREEWAHDNSILLLDGRRYSDLANGHRIEVYFDYFRRVILEPVEDSI